MEKTNSISRRVAVKSSVFGILGLSVSNILFAKNITGPDPFQNPGEIKNSRYPAIEDAITSEVVGVSHFNLDRLKALVDPRPELARAVWDWGFGDWESALGAASHVGRRDIVDYLMLKGARPDLFTYAMMGSYIIVRSMIEASPGLQRLAGPHGISLLQHVKNGINASNEKNPEAVRLQNYLESLGDADSPSYMSMDETDKQKYLGDYKYGEGENDGFTITLNMRKMISLGKLGKNGGALYKLGDNKFMYNGAPSVIISFLVENDKVISMSVAEPGLKVVARKIK